LDTYFIGIHIIQRVHVEQGTDHIHVGRPAHPQIHFHARI
jgi:hypothetical protein